MIVIVKIIVSILFMRLYMHILSAGQACLVVLSPPAPQPSAVDPAPPLTSCLSRLYPAKHAPGEEGKQWRSHMPLGGGGQKHPLEN